MYLTLYHADFDSKSLFQTGGGLRLQSSERGFEHPVPRDCLLTSRHFESRVQRSFWKCIAPAAGETEAKWTMKKNKTKHQDAAEVVQMEWRLLVWVYLGISQ